MENIITTVLPYISPAALPLVVVVVAFIYIQSKRKEVGKKRDEYEVLTNYRLDMLEKNQGSLTDSIKELQNAIVNLQISVNSLIIEIKNLKEKD